MDFLCFCVNVSRRSPRTTFQWGQPYCLKYSFEDTFSDWSEGEVTKVQTFTHSIDGAVVKPRMFCLFGQGFVRSDAD